MTQASRLLRYLQEHAEASSLDIIRDLYIVNVTGRISDLRKAGHDIRCFRDAEGTFRFRLETPVLWPGLR